MKIKSKSSIWNSDNYEELNSSITLELKKSQPDLIKLEQYLIDPNQSQINISKENLKQITKILSLDDKFLDKWIN